MELKKKKSYQSYRFRNRDELQDIFLKTPQTFDRNYMLEMILPIIQFLDQHEIHEYEDFTQVFKNNKFRTVDILDLINSFQKFINSNETYQHINWIKPRELKKSNLGEKNIILNRFAIEYPNELIFYIKEYLSPKYPEGFIKELNKKIEKLRNTSQVKIFLKHFE